MSFIRKKASNFSFVSLGCARTLVDSEGMINDLKQNGFSLVPEGSSDSVTVLNTCSFIQSAIDETEDNIRRLLARKQSGEIQHLAVVGCYPSRFKKEELYEKFSGVDLWLTTQEQSQLQTHLSELVFQKKFSPRPYQSLYTKLTPSHYSYLKISEGCDNWCSFCTIPRIREHRSLPLEDIIKQAEFYIQCGSKELLIVAEDTTAWGEDLYGKPSLPLLLDALAQLDVSWIRPMYIFPSRVDTALIKVMAKYPSKFSYLDMPIQHVSTRLLHAMNRRHDSEFIHSLLNRLFEAIPTLALRTTFIAGYPSETEEEAHEILEFLKRYPIMHVGCFGYSDEPTTRSFKSDLKLDPATVLKRVDSIMNMQYDLLLKRNQSLVSTVVPCVYEGNGRARAVFQAPEVDGVLLVEPASELPVGTFTHAKLQSVEGYDFKATLI